MHTPETNVTGDGFCASDFSAAARSWWDSDADDYHARHPTYLGVDGAEFYWCPEMLHESTARLLGRPAELRGASILELGCGSAPCSRWLAQDLGDSTFITAFDISAAMLRHAGDHRGVDLVQADAMALPYRGDSFDVVFSAFGAIPFVSDSAALMREVARVLRPGGRFVFSVTHPMRWIFTDDPGPTGLTAVNSYFSGDYVERDERNGRITYAEQHRTMGERLGELTDAGFRLERLLEPEWPADLDVSWGQWSPLRGGIFPGSAIFCSTLD
ncbi:class I SAM-dependent methyltransferase [Corynebacterium pacaense]|uniref:class I SAM-dependent methyltransferase n=1 Tax=Corynebacterium pacaense TaxID=1816684 RepID=UPI0009BB04FF|nr:class I SAM-dependent methyltransferase [Corynebacterium pacaense]